MHFSFDLLISDAWSARLLFSDFTRLFHDPGASLKPLDITFRDYVLALEHLPQTTAYQRSAAYWQARLPELPPAPELPLARDPATIGEPLFVRRQTRLEPELWQRLSGRAATAGITPSGLLLAVYAEVLAAWSASPALTINVTTFNRLPVHEQIRDLVGDFTSLTLLGVDAVAGSFEQRARRIQEQLWQDLDHRFVSGIQVLRDLASQQGRAPGALMPVVFTSRLFDTHHDGRDLPGSDDGSPGVVVYSVSQTPQVWLDKQIYEEEGALAWTWDVVDGLFPDGLVDAMFDAYRATLVALAEDDDLWHRDVLELLPSAQQELWRSVNATDTALEELLLHEAFVRQAQRAPERPAVICTDRVLSYGELATAADCLAAMIPPRNGDRERLIAIVMDKGWEQVVAAYGVLLAGDAYLPMDPAWPQDRRDYVLAHAGVDVVLTQERFRDALAWPDAVTLLAVDTLELSRAPAEASANSQSSARRVPDRGDLAYVIFTSGSTGKPKGVAIEHGSAMNTVLDINQRYGVGVDDRALAVSNLTFDLSVYDLFGPLSVGGAVVIPETSASGRPDPDRWLELVAEHDVSLWNSVPTLVDLLVTAADAGPGLPESLRVVLMSGDWLPLDIADRIRGHLPTCRVTSLGGATEGSIWSIAYDIETVDPAWTSVPYGKALANQHMYVFDHQLRPRPQWVPGDIFIGGVGVAREYLGDPELTAGAYLEHPRTGERVYRTGDLGRMLPDGNLEFLGRKDFQVKVHGHRIELGEIEAGLLSHDGVSAVVATAPWTHGHGGPGDARRLVAYVVGEVEHDALREHLRRSVPEYMVPALIIDLEALPLTANGKVDRKALDRLAEEHVPSSSPARSLSAQEQRIATLWSEALGVEQIGPDDGFFDLGGNSLLALQLLSKLRDDFEVPLTLQSLFEHVTVAELAAAIGEMKAAGQRQEREEAWPVLSHDADAAHEPFPLTAVQQAYWIGRMEGLAGGNIAAHAYYELDSTGFDVAAFERQFRRMIQRHDALRIVISADGRQRILKDVPPYEVQALDLRQVPEDLHEQSLQAVRDHMSHQVLSTDEWPIFEVRATRLDDERTRLHLSFDLLIADAWSSRVLFHDLALCLRGEAESLAPLDVSFRDYVLAEQALHHSPRYGRSRAYWTERLHQLPAAPDLPILHGRDEDQPPRFTRRQGSLAAPVWQRLKDRGARLNLTPSGLVLAAFCEILTRWSREPRYMVNITTFNRLPLHPQVVDLMGDFTSLTLLAVDHDSAHDGFADRARRVQEQLWADLDHRHMNGVEVLRELARVDGGNLTPRAPVVFTSRLFHDDRFLSGDDNREVFGEVVYSVSQTPQVWLDHQVVEEDGELGWTWDALDGLFPDGMIESMFETYLALLHRLADQDSAWTDGPGALVPSLAARSLSADMGAVEEGLLHTAFERQAALHPERPAVLADRVLSYGELALAARRIAGWLRRHGAEPDTLVAVVLPKGWQQLAAVLGVLHSGAAYLPIDPNLPAERIADLLTRGEVRLVLGDSTSDLALGERSMLAVDTAAFDPGLPATPLEPVQRPDQLAYVIFTSGSTGLPKGVAVEHRAAYNTIRDINARFDVGPDDRVLALSSLSFDLSVYDIFGLLAVGGAVVIPRPGTERDPGHWGELLHEHRVTLWNSVPALMEMMMDSAEAGSDPAGRLPSTLKAVLMSGDWIPVGLPERIRAQAPGARVTSLGGATEAAIWSILYPIEDVDPAWPSIPYGRGMENQYFHVLDQALQPRPTWVPGELFISGVGLAREYWRDTQKTDAAFFTHPETGERLYRTGDHGRFLGDGNIEFLGRRDSQVKILGYRVELGEIEAALGEQPGVANAVVLAPFADGSVDGGGVQGTGRHRRLVAYVVPTSEQVPGDFGDREKALKKVPGGFAEASGTVPGEFGAVPGDCLDRENASETVPGTFPGANLDTFARLMACLRQVQPDGMAVPKYRYPSGGGLYPVQVYVTVADVEGLTAGVYAYHPAEHRLLLLREGAENGPPFTLHLVGRESAVGPLYPEWAGKFCALESGYMSALLNREAATQGWTLHRRGPGDFESIRSSLPFEPTDGWVLSLAPEPTDEQLGDDGPAFVRSWREQAMTDPIERLGFKMQQKGLPTPDRVLGTMDLPGAGLHDLRTFESRRSARSFLPEAMGTEPLMAWLSVLPETSDFDVYLHVVPGRMELAAGAYRYQPSTRRLTLLDPDARLDRDAHGPVNRPIHDQAACTLFFVATAEAPELSVGCMVRCGELGQDLMETALGHGIGLCPLGGIDENQVRQALGLDVDQRVAHLFSVGGVPREPVTLEQALKEEQDVLRRVAEPAPAPQSHAAPQSADARVLDDGAHGLDTAALEAGLAARLPDYMVPAAWVFLDRLPLTANGKVDRNALVTYRAEPAKAVGSGVPQNELETTIRDVICEVLALESVGTYDNFFELGANSLQLIRAHGRLQEVLERQIPITHLFGNPTVVALAGALGEQREEALEAGRDRARRRKDRGRSQGRRRRRRGGDE